MNNAIKVEHGISDLLSTIVSLSFTTTLSCKQKSHCYEIF